MTINELIQRLEAHNIPTNIATEEDLDPYTLEGKMNLIIKALANIDEQEGTEVKVNNEFVKNLSFNSDPQTQITANADYCDALDATKADYTDLANKADVSLVNTKQDKLSQVDLDNIASINQINQAVENNTNR